MNIVPSSFTVAELCQQFEQKTIRINRHYQRSDQVWPDAARSFLIETIILGFPVPKITLAQKTDLKKLKTYKEIVDGQQRTHAIIDFFRGDLRLGKNVETEELRDSTIEEISDNYREQFVSYSVGSDVLVGAEDEEIREVFRRINSYTVPLNPEEQRHATYQGAFKWFIYELTRACEKTFSNLRVFSEKDFVRMQDAKLLTEICHALVHGIQTTSAKKLTGLYRDLDKDFEKERDFRSRITRAVDFLSGYEILEDSDLSKAFNFYSLMLATIHAHKSVAVFEPILGGREKPVLSEKRIGDNLSLLNNVLMQDTAPREYKEFWDACSERTNVKSQRDIRLRWLYKALTQAL